MADTEAWKWNDSDQTLTKQNKKKRILNINTSKKSKH